MITIPGEPVACPRPRVAKGRAYYPAKYTRWRKMATQAVSLQCPRCRWPEGALAVTITALWTRPKSRPQAVSKDAWASGRRVPRAALPDADNVGKSVLDALTSAGVWGDDAQVTDLVVRKRYAARGESPGIHIEIQEVTWEAQKASAAPSLE